MLNSRLNLRHVALIGDNQSLVIRLSSSDIVPPWEVSSILHDIRLLVKQWTISCFFVSINCNRTAHWLANRTCSNCLFGDWVGCPPSLVSLVVLDG